MTLTILTLVLLGLTCVHHGKAERSMENVTFRCCTGVADPYIFESDAREERGFDGMSMDYLALLKERTGMDCSYINNTEGRGVGWNAIIDHIVDCTKDGETDRSRDDCYCDIGIGGWYQGEDRMDVDFLPPFVYGHLTVVVHIDNTVTSIGGLFFLTGFSPLVWAGISGLIILFSILKLLDRQFVPQSATRESRPRLQSRYGRCREFVLKDNMLRRLRKAIQSTFSRMIRQPPSNIPGDTISTRQWVINFAIALCGILIVLAYEASMTAALVQETIHSAFKDVNDFKECRIRDDDICFVKGEIVEQFWERSLANKACRKNGANGKPKKNFNNFDEISKKLASKECKYAILDAGIAGFATNGRYCGKLLKTGEPFFEGGIAMVLPLGSKYVQPLLEATLELRSQGSLFNTVDEYFEQGGVCEIQSKPQLDLRKLRIFFGVAAVACVLILAEMVFDPQNAVRESRNTEVLAAEAEEKDSSGSGSDVERSEDDSTTVV